MKTIIAAVDFSAGSITAANYAADLAATLNAQLLLLHIVQVPVTISEIPESGYAFDRLIEDSDEELSKLKSRLAHKAPAISIETKTQVGSVLGGLDEESKLAKAICVVIGTDKITTLEHLFSEDHALAAIHGLSIPVLIIPDEASFRPITKIMLAADMRDGEPFSFIDHVKEWVTAFSANLDVVNVVQSSGDNKITALLRLEKQLEGLDPQFHFVHEDDISEGIRAYIELHRPDLLMTIPRKHGFLSGLVHRSQSKRLIRHPQLPVLCIPG